MPTEKEINAGIFAGAKAVQEEAEKGLGIKRSAEAPSTEPPVLPETTVSVSQREPVPAAPADAAAPVLAAQQSEKPTESSGKGKAGQGRRRVTTNKKKTGGKSAVGKPETGASAALKRSEGVKPVSSESKQEESESRPEWAAATDSAYEVRTVVSAALDKKIATEAPLGSQEMVSVQTDPVLAVETFPSAETAIGETKPIVEAASDTKKLDTLREEVAGLRVKYVKESYDRTTAMSKLKGFFRGLNESGENPDADYWQGQYQNKLIDLQEAELEKLKQSGIKGQELRDAMAGTLRYFKVDETLSLIADRDKVRSESKEWSGKVMDAMRVLGERYNKLSTTKKILVGSAVALGAAATGLAGGGALYGSALLLTKKIIASTGLSVAFDARGDKKMKEQFEAQAEREIESELAKIFVGAEASEPAAEAFQWTPEKLDFINKIADDTDASYKKLISQRRMNGVKGAALGFGITFGGGFLTQWAMEHGGNEAVHGAKELLFGTEPDPVITEPIVAVRSEMPMHGLVDAARVPEAATGALVPPDDTANFLEEHVLTSTDGKKGLWGVLESRLPEDMPQADKTRVVAALEKIISEKLETMPPEELREAGFGSGDISKIMAGDTIHFDKVLSPDQVRSVISGEYVGNAVSESAASASLELPRIEAVDTANDIHSWSELTPDSSPVAEEAADTVVASTPETFTSALQPRVDNWFSQIFRIDSETIGSGHDWVFDQEKLGKIKISDMMRDARLYQQGSLSGYRTGLSAEQLENFARFFQNAGTGVDDQRAMAMINMDTMRPEKNMTVMEYLERVAPLAKQGQRFGLFSTSA